MSNLSSYLKRVATALDAYDGASVARALSSDDSDVRQLAEARKIPNGPQLDMACGDALMQPYDEMVSQLLQRTDARRKKNMVEAYGHQTAAMNAFNSSFKTDSNWSIAVMQTLARDLRQLSFEADAELLRQGKKPEKVADAGRQLMNCFSLCNSDRAALEENKKWGILKIVNELLRLYFANNQLHMCKPLVRSTEAVSGPQAGAARIPLEELAMSDRVAYAYFTGRLAILDDEYTKGAELLSFALSHCHRDARENRRRVLIHLIPVKLLAGQLPSTALLADHGLEAPFGGVVEAVRTGSPILLQQALMEHEEFYIETSTFLIVEKLKNVVYRNVCKAVLTSHAPETRFPIHYFQAALKVQGCEMALDEVECIVATLIATGFIKGYISHQHAKVVLSKDKAFPPLSTLMG